MKSPETVQSWFAWWAAFFALYLVLVSRVTLAESGAGALAAALAASGTLACARAAELHFRPHLGWLGWLVRLPGRVLADCGIVAGALWTRLVRGGSEQGVFRTIPFEPGHEDAGSAARRALVTAGVSLAPNTYVVAIDRQRGLLLVHQLVASAEPPGHGDREWPL